MTAEQTLRHPFLDMHRHDPTWLNIDTVHNNFGRHCSNTMDVVWFGKGILPAAPFLNNKYVQWNQIMADWLRWGVPALVDPAERSNVHQSRVTRLALRLMDAYKHVSIHIPLEGNTVSANSNIVIQWQRNSLVHDHLIPFCCWTLADRFMSATHSVQLTNMAMILNSPIAPGISNNDAQLWRPIRVAELVDLEMHIMRQVLSWTCHVS